MKTMHFFRIAVIIACVGLFFACSKSNSSGSSTAATEDNLQTQSDDQTMASNEDDAMNNDVDVALTSNATIAGSSYTSAPVNGGATTLGVNGIDSVSFTICDATITYDTTSTTRTVTITYNGANCWGNRKRTGSISITVPTGVHWGDVGATVSISVDNLAITRIRDNKTITFNGTKTITNVSGGLLKNLASLQSVTHTISASLTIMYPNGKTADWNVAKQRVFTYNNGIEITTTGTNTQDTVSNIAEWGTNRFGVSYVSQISVAKVIDQSCDYRLTSGQNIITNSKGATATITYGLDATGSPTSCPGTGFYYAELVYVTAAGKSFTYIFPY